MHKFSAKLLCLVMALVMLGTALTGCTGGKGGAGGSSRTVVDMTGNTITLPEKVEKVHVDWASGITLAMTLGATDKLVAAPTAFEGDTFAWAREICPAINNVKKDQDAFTNLESALNYEPDLVITSTKDNIETYQNLGLPVVYVTFNSNETFKESLKIVGKALGEKEYAAAERYAAYFDANVAMVSQRLSKLTDADKQTVYYMDSRFGDCYHTVGKGEIQEEWISCAGGILATAAILEGRNLEINSEKMLDVDPDIVIIGAQNQADVYDQLMVDPVLAGMSAVKNGTVYRAPQGIFPWCRNGPEAAIQMVWAAKLLHPAEFADVDIKAVAKDFYKTFYGNDVSDAVIDGILAGKLCPTGK